MEGRLRNAKSEGVIWEAAASEMQAFATIIIYYDDIKKGGICADMEKYGSAYLRGEIPVLRT
jgi:hypothetical protein